MQDLFLNCFSDFNVVDSSSSMLTLNVLGEEEARKQMRHVLKSYALLSKQRLAEQLYTDNVVKPYMNHYLNESFLQTNIRKLTGVYEKILDFIDQNNEFLKITNEIKSR
jgi:hypothetical protein